MLSTAIRNEEIGPNPRRPRVLIVENEGLVALHFCALIEPLGFEIVGITGSGNKAVEMARQNRPDLVLMDIEISPGLSGIETAVCLQRLYDRPIPIVFVTGRPVDDFPMILSSSLLRGLSGSNAS